MSMTKNELARPRILLVNTSGQVDMLRPGVFDWVHTLRVRS